MIIAIAFLAGATLGWVRATKRGGTLSDHIQFALAHGIPAALLALVLVVLSARML
ncbi:MAG: hypothetical protein AAF317_06690 [Pseudomonadota bacterium]